MGPSHYYSPKIISPPEIWGAFFVLGFYIFGEEKMEDTEQNQQVKEVTIFRLSETQLKLLEKEIGPPFVNKDTSELQAGFLLGIQYIMKKLRDGFKND